MPEPTTVGTAPAAARALERTSAVLAVLVTGLGLLVLLGWLLDVPRLKRADPGALVSMKANCALAFTLAGLALVLGRSATPRATRAARACALGVTLIGLGTLVEHASGVDLRIDQLLARDLDPGLAFAPGRMPPLAAACFTLLGLATLGLDVDLGRRARRPAQWLALGAGVLSLLPFTAQLYDVETLYGLARYSQLAVHTTLGLVLLAPAVLFARPDRGLMSSITSASQAGFLTRRLLPAVLVLPLALGWVVLAAQHSGQFGPRFGLGVFAVTISVGLTALMWWSLVALHRAEVHEREARAVLADREELQTTLLSIGDGVISTDADGRIVRMNPVAERLTGWSLQEAAGRPFDDVFRIVRADDGAPAESPARRVLAAGAAVGLAGRTLLVGRDGQRRPIADSGAPIRDAAGALRGVVLVFRDMTEEVEGQRALRESEARNKAALGSALDAVVLMDHRGDVVEWNPAAERTFGYTRAEVVGRPLADLIVPPSLRERHSSGLARCLETGAGAILGRRMELPALRKDGTEFPAEVSVVRMGDGRGPPTFTGFIRDNSEHRRLAEVKARSLELEVENRQIQEANRLKSEFLANMSHELRTPLNAIIGFAELLHDGEVAPDLPEHKTFLGHILTSGQHLLQLINDVLDLAKVEAGKLDFHPTPVDLGKVINEVMTILRAAAEAKHIPVEVTVDPAVAEVVVDPSRLKQVLYNYLSNALKFTPDGGRVSVRARPEGPDGFRLEVQDTGIGIAQADLDRLFVEFQQLDTGLAKQHGGTGLGLALARRLVEAQGGTVGVTSAPGRGSTFHAVLPTRATARGRPLPTSRTYPSPRAGSPTVLVIEDDERDQAKIVDALTAAGYGVESATTGEEAIAKSRERQFDAVTLDLLLPDMSGLQVLRNLRKGGKSQDAPVIVVTTVTEGGAVNGFTVHDVLRKPPDGDELLGSLRRAGIPPEAGAVLVVDDDPRALDLMAASLAQLGYRSRCASRGAVALESAAGSPPAAVVLDLMMPGMDGFEFLERFRRIPRCRRVPVIVWTVMDLTPAEHARLRASAQGVVHKDGDGDAGAGVVQELKTFLDAGLASAGKGG